ncbi:MAG: adenylate/guanylate cyclase domain-containing protein [Hyphomicrobium sp.]
MERRLAAILAADVVGYSRLMELDEVGTLAALKTYRKELIDPAIAEHRGRIVKLMGDGTLVEFASVVDAVTCAVAIQTGTAQRRTGALEDRRIDLRIGVHLGDIIVEGADIYGEGVNVAARLEGLTEPGGICLSGDAYRQVRGKVEANFEDLGERKVKNLAEPLRVYRIAIEGPSSAITPGETKPLPLPDKPSIAVLPFENMSGDTEQGYFADGITEDITTALSRISGLFVIARNSAFTYQGKVVDVRQVGRELGVRYLLEGSVRKAGDRLRITGQLVDTGTGAHLWADKFDSTSEDVFDLQDRVTATVAGAIEPSVTQAEIERASLKPTDNLQAYDCLLKALGESQLYSREGVDRAIRLARRATEMDPRYAQAYAYIASWLQLRKIYGWMENEAEEIEEGIRLAYLAVQLQPNDPTVLTQAAFALAHLNRDLVTAIPWFDRAIALNPNSAMAFGRGAVVRNFAGEYAIAANHADRAIRLSPFDPFMFAFSMARGISHFFRRELADAIAWLRKAAQENPQHTPTFFCLASALAHSGQLDDARAAMSRVMDMRPMSSVTWHRQRRPYPDDDYEYLLDGARRAGLPD